MSPALAPDQVEQARRMRANGATYAAIAERFGVSISGVHYRLGITHEPVKRVQLSDGQIEQLRALRAAGVSINEIAERFGIKRNTVSYHTANREVKQERPEPTPDELLLSAFPWAYTLPPAAREQFAHELAHRPKYEFERDLDQFISRWRFMATYKSAS